MNTNDINLLDCQNSVKNVDDSHHVSHLLLAKFPISGSPRQHRLTTRTKNFTFFSDSFHTDAAVPVHRDAKDNLPQPFSGKLLLNSYFHPKRLTCDCLRRQHEMFCHSSPQVKYLSRVSFAGRTSGYSDKQEASSYSSPAYSLTWARFH